MLDVKQVQDHQPNRGNKAINFILKQQKYCVLYTIRILHIICMYRILDWLRLIFF